MNIFVAVVATAAIAGASAVAWRIGGPAGRPFDPSSPIRVVLLVYLLMYGLGSVGIAAVGEAAAGPLVVSAGFVSLAIGAWAGTRAFGRPRAFAGGMVEGDVQPIAVALLAAVGLVGYAWLALRFGIPLLADDPQSTRASYGGIPLDMFRWLVPPAALVAYGIALVRRSGRSLAIAAVLIAVVIALEILFGSRALPFEVGVAALLMFLWTGRRIPLRVWFLLGLATAVLFVGVLFARIGSRGGFPNALAAAEFAAVRTVSRVLLIHPRTIDLVVDTFPAEQEFLGGATYVRWLGPLTGGERQESLAAMLFRKLFPLEPPGGFAAPGILGEAWANAGLVLAALLMGAVGFAAAGLSRLGTILGASVVDRVFLAVLTVALARSYASSLNGLVLTLIVATGWWLVCSGRLERLITLALRRLSRPATVTTDPPTPANRQLDDDPSSLLP